MPGIVELYIATANDHVKSKIAADIPFKISRASVELMILRELDKASFPIEYKVSWYDAILTSQAFTTFWLGLQHQHSLPDASIARYVPNPALWTYTSTNPALKSFFFPSLPNRPHNGTQAPITPGSRNPDNDDDDDDNDDVDEDDEPATIEPSSTSTLEPAEIWYGEKSSSATKKKKKRSGGKRGRAKRSSGEELAATLRGTQHVPRA